MLPKDATHVTFVVWVLAQADRLDPVGDIGRDFRSSIEDFTREEWALAYLHIPYPPDLVAQGKLETYKQWVDHVSAFNRDAADAIGAAWVEFRQYKVEHHEFD